MGSSTELYNLGWSEFDSSLKSAVKGLRSRGDFVDVTLAAGGRFFPAHKLVLSAASTLFLELLKVTPCQHPVILLAGVSASDLESLLDFVYCGEVNIQPSQLSSLLQAAHILNIQGLGQGSVRAEKPEDQNDAEAALAASTLAGQKPNPLLLGAATRSDLIASVNCGARSRRKRKTKWKHSETSDTLINKCGKYDSDDDSSDAELMKSTTKAGQTSVESIPKFQKHNFGSISAMSATNASLKSTTSKGEQGAVLTSGGNQTSNFGDASRSISSNLPEANLVSPHHLDFNEDEDSRDGSLNFLLGKVTQYGSNQPGMCPLCGIAIRQSRNLRRHLLVSCKYRSSLQHAKEFQTPSENRTLSGLEEEQADSSCSESNKICASRDLKPTVVDLITEDETSILDSIQPEEIVCRPQIAASSDFSANTENE